MIVAAQEYSERRWLILVILSIGAFLSPLDFFIVNVALPDIKMAFGATDTALQLVVAGYGLTYAVLVVTGGRLGDIFGRKRVFMSGMLLFIAASVACAAAGKVEWLIAARIFQGMGAAMLAPQVIATIRVIFPPAEQPRAMGVFGAVFGLAAIAGQLLGGMLINARLFGLTWETVFLVNLPVGIVCCILAYVFMQENNAAKRPGLDIGGMLLATLTLLLFIYPLVKGRELHWPWWIFACLLLSLVSGYLLFSYEAWMLRRQQAPLLYIPLLKDAHFLKGAAVIYLYNHTAAFFLIFPFYLQNGLRQDAFTAGLAVMPYAIGFFLAPLLSPHSGMSVRQLTRGGMLLLAGGFVVCSLAMQFSPQPGWLLQVGLLLAGTGHGTVMPAMLRRIMAEVDVRLAGQAAGIISTAIQVGSVTGTAVIGTLFFSLLAHFSYSRAMEIAFILLAMLMLAGYLLAGNYNHTKKLSDE